jgi:peptide/nickel transport system substrate-binding protein
LAIQNEYISPRNFDILLFGEIVGFDPDPYPFWHSSQISTTGLNLSNFKHAEADQVLREARETADIKKKTEKYIHFQNILVAEIPAIFLYNPNYLYPVDKKIKGIDQTSIINPTDRLTNVHKWYIKTKRSFK